VLFATTVAALALSGLAGAAGGGPSTLAFSDPAGDAAGAADITHVAVNGDAASGTITFAVTASGLALPSADGSERSVDLWLNTDRNDSTGSGSGNEYDLSFWTDSSDPAQWSWDIENYANGAWQEVAQTTTMRVGGSGNQFVFQLNKSDLGGATSFDIYATSTTFDANGNLVAHESAPDQGRWVYDIAGPSQTLTMFLTPTIGKPVLVPSTPTSGKRLTVSFPVTVNGGRKPTAPLTSLKIVGTALVAGKAVAHATSLHDGGAVVSFVVPKTARGKPVKVTVTVTAPSSEDDNGAWIDAATGETGLLANITKGGSATKTVSATVH
jgi:hypothetical protein